MQGKIIKGIAGFYYVHVTGRDIYECKAKGIFRRENKKPLVGDDVDMEVLDEKEKLGNIVEILPRSQALLRPAVANIDQALLVFAVAKPKPSFHLLDSLLIMMQKQAIPCILCFNKLDIASDQEQQELQETYAGSGSRILFTSAVQRRGIEELKTVLRGKTTAVAGSSGVGKSSLINILQDDICMETASISHKIDRGKHTTRHTQLIAMEENTYIMDTPGFSSFSLTGIEKEELGGFYAEFAGYEAACRFQGCSHIKEPGCRVKEALQEGRINRIRYDNYVVFYTELSERRRY